MLYKEDPDYNRIVNLYLITFLISRWTDNLVFVNDPNYIKEKWNRFIGFRPRRHFEPNSMDKNHIRMYTVKWGHYGDVYPQIMYLASEHYLRFDKMIENFERYIGPFGMINPNPAGGLHPNSMAAIPKILEQNSNKIKEFLRPKIIDRITNDS
jgi:hypothetical protein